MGYSNYRHNAGLLTIQIGLIAGVALTILLDPSTAAGQTTTTTLPIPAAECTVDMQGADDEPGQKDLNQFCEEAGASGDASDLHVSWNFDDVAWSGNNTGDGCALFDTDGNDFADFALCVTIEDGPPATQQSGSPRLYMCGNDRRDRCTDSVEVSEAFSSTCMVNDPGQDSDPFESDPGHTGSSVCGGSGCELEDAFITCWIETDDLPGSESCQANTCTNIPGRFCVSDADCVPIIDVCSYPSMQPNSDPSDCIITPTAQDPCKNVDCSHIDDECNVGICRSSDGACIAEPRPAGTACGDGADDVCNNPDTCDGHGVCEPNYESDSTVCREDAGECDVAETCDGAGACPIDGFETSGTSCGDGTDDVCDNPDICDGHGVCEPNFESGATICRGDAGECDIAETCDGAGSCPADSFEPSGTSCGDGSDVVCDNPDTCDGHGTCEPNYETSTTVCREDAGECDIAETCDGAGACPVDGFEPSGTSCGDGTDDVCDNPDTCDGHGTCESNYEISSTVCREDAGECDVAETCDGTGACPADGFEPSGTSCGDGTNDVCDNPDTCDGLGVCEPNFEASSTVCREDTGECDVAETCDGAGACPADAFEPSGTSCGDGTNDVCDNPDTCNGLGVCEPNFEASSTVCREDTGECDIAETCDGAGACPVDGFEPSGTSCGDGTDDVCDNPDTCDGHGTCESNYEISSTVCREDAGECDVAETCDGAGACPADGFEPSGTSCGDGTNDVCDNPDTCDGLGVCEPNFEASSTVCREDTGECDVAETCDGAGACPVDGFEASGTSCGDGTDDVCDNPDTCDGHGTCESNYEISSTVCREDAGECDVAETCDGAGACPADGFEPSGTSCGDGTNDVCDNPDTCDGLGVCEPNFEASSTVCREDTGECDVAETCDGAGACPVDGFEASGTSCGDGTDDVCDNPDTCDGHGTCESNYEISSTVCREDAGECDVAETCDGAGACPADGFEPSGTSCGDGTNDVCDNPDTCDGLGVCEPNYESGSTVCRSDAGQCDVAETCDGAGLCPAEAFEADGFPCDDGEVCTGDDICRDGTCEGDPITPRLTVVKQVINEIRGTLEADDFRLLLDDGTQTEFRVEVDSIDPSWGSATFEMEHGAQYQVTEILGELADYYAVSYSDGCTNTASCSDPDQTCVVTNDDIYRNQASISVRSLAIEFAEGDESRMHVEGAFSITDESESGSEPDGFIVLLDDYALDWEHRNSSDTTWEPSLHGGQHGGSLEIDGIEVVYTCDYDVIDIDGVATVPEGYQSGDPVPFDETVTIGYDCWFDRPLPEDGKLRGIASTGIFAKSGHWFLRRATFALDGSGMTIDEEEVDAEDPKTCDDPNSDGKTSATDALFLLRVSVGMNGPDGIPPLCPHAFCDQNCDGNVSASDALTSMMRGLGLLKKAGLFCCE